MMSGMMLSQALLTRAIGLCQQGLWMEADGKLRDVVKRLEATTHDRQAQRNPDPLEMSIGRDLIRALVYLTRTLHALEQPTHVNQTRDRLEQEVLRWSSMLSPGEQEQGAADLVHLATVLAEAELIAAAAILFRAAVRLLEPLSDDAPHTRRGVWAQAQESLGMALHASGQPEEAMQRLDLAQAAFRALIGLHPERYRRHLARVLNNTVVVLRDGRHDVDAERTAREAVALYEMVMQGGAGDVRHELARAHYNLAMVIIAQQRYHEAEPALRRAATLLEPLADDDPQAAIEFVGTLTHWHDALRRTGNPDAGQVLDQAVTSLNQPHAWPPLLLATVLLNTAVGLMQEDRDTDARPVSPRR